MITNPTLSACMTPEHQYALGNPKELMPAAQEKLVFSGPANQWEHYESLAFQNFLMVRGITPTDRIAIFRGTGKKKGKLEIIGL